jgi:hypothetical protein
MYRVSGAAIAHMLSTGLPTALAFETNPAKPNDVFSFEEL